MQSAVSKINEARKALLPTVNTCWCLGSEPCRHQRQRADELQRQEAIKNRILQAVVNGCRELVTPVMNNAEGSQVLYGCEKTDKVCAGVEAMFLHGLDVPEDPAKDLWLFMTELAPADVISKLATQNRTYVSRCRAFIKDFVNRQNAPLSLDNLVSKSGTVRRFLDELYHQYAFIKDEDRRQSLITKLDVLQQLFDIKLRTDHESLRSWCPIARDLLDTAPTPDFLTPQLATSSEKPQVGRDEAEEPSKEKTPQTDAIQLTEEEKQHIECASQVLLSLLRAKEATIKADDTDIDDDDDEDETAGDGDENEEDGEVFISIYDENWADFMDRTSENGNSMTDSASSSASSTSSTTSTKPATSSDKPTTPTPPSAKPTPASAKPTTPTPVSAKPTTLTPPSAKPIPASAKPTTPTPSSAKPTPASAKPTTPTPSSAKPTPSSAEPTTPTPASAKPTPVSAKPIPASAKPTPASAKPTTPTPASAKPTPASAKPTTPTTSSAKPTTSSAKPTTPTTSSAKPTTSTTLSAKPTTSTTSSAKPTTSSAKPNASSSKPTTTSSRPSTSSAKTGIVITVSRRNSRVMETAPSTRSQETVDTIRATIQALEDLPPPQQQENSSVSGVQPDKKKFSLLVLLRKMLQALRKLVSNPPPKSPEELARLAAGRERFLEKYTSDYALSMPPNATDSKTCVVCQDVLVKGRIRKCHLSGQKCCRICHRNKKAIIPYRIISAFDFRRYHVCEAAYEFLQSTETRVWMEDYAYKPCKQTAFAAHTDKTMRLRSEVVANHWRLQGCSKVPVCPKQPALHAVTSDSARLIVRFSVQELLLIKKKKLDKALIKTVKAQRKHMKECPLHSEEQTCEANQQKS